ncbi:MAG: NAD+ synthase, partial [Hyphomicrobiales bacterium]
MTDRLRIALAQLNPTVGALAANLELGRKALADAAAAKADIILFPELFITGYFPDDLLFKPRFVADAMATAEEFAKATAGTGVTAIMPCVGQDGGKLYNSVLICENGEVVARRYKRELPNDDIFYERRYFERAELQEPVTIKGVSIGIPICEDIWHPEVCAHLVDNGARMLLCPNGSPYWRNKQATRYKLVRDRVAEDNVPMLYLNQVGGQDELVYDGASFGIEPGGRLVVQAK